MDFASLFHSRRLLPIWTYKTAGILWRMMFSETGFIVGEDRSMTEKAASYFCVNAQNGDLLWEKMTYSEAWWIGMEAVVLDRVYLHGFRKADSPEHKKIVCIDLGTGRELWRNNDYTFYYAAPGVVIAYRDLYESRIIAELDSSSGECLREHEEIPEDLVSHRTVHNSRADFLYPESIALEQPGASSLEKFIIPYCELTDLRGAVEAMRTEGKLVFNFHAALDTEQGTRPLFANHFIIADELKGGELFHEILNASTPAVVPGSFFADGPIVYYVKEKMILTAINVSSEDL